MAVGPGSRIILVFYIRLSDWPKVSCWFQAKAGLVLGLPGASLLPGLSGVLVLGDTLSYKGQPLLPVGQACSPQNCKQGDPKVGWNSFSCGSPVATVVCPMPAPMPSRQVTGVKDSCPFTEHMLAASCPSPSFISEPFSSPARWGLPSPFHR